MTETSPTAWAELEIGIMPGTGDNYNVQLRFRHSNNASYETYTTSVALPFDALQQQLYDIPAYGNTLSQALFADQTLRDRLLRAITTAGVLQVPLRLRIALDATLPQVHALLWETLKDPFDSQPEVAQRRVLATNQDVLFSRYVSGKNWQPLTLPSRDDLRALVVIANPSNLERYELTPIDVQAEQSQAQDSLQPVAEVTTLAAGGQATLNEINRHLLNGYHMLYLVAHGAVRAGKTRLWLEQENGEAAVVEADELVKVLADMGRRRPVLVVLVACQSGVTSAEVSLDDGERAETAAPVKHAALAVRLLEAGVPAVLAMQGNLTMDTARKFLPIFFQELQRSGQPDYALTAARGVIRHQQDWWVPVLFQRVQNGCVWKEGEPAAANEPPVQPATAGPPTPSTSPAPINLSSIAQETIDQRKLREKMHELFSLEDLEIICDTVEQNLQNDGIQLQVNLEVVGGSGKRGKILKLIDYLDRRGHLAYLIAAAMEENARLKIEDIT